MSPADRQAGQPTSDSLTEGRFGRWTPYVLAGAFFLTYLTVALARWRRMQSPSWDLAIFEQAVRGYAGLGAPIVDIKGPGFNLLGDHFSPLLAVLAPLYAIFSTPVTLLVAQAALVAFSVVPITRVALRVLGFAAGLSVGSAYGMSWGIQSAIDVEFHEVALAVPLLALALEAFLNERWLAAAAWTAPLVLVKEDLGLTVAVMGLCLALRGQRRVGAALSTFGVGAFLLVLLVLVPAVNPEDQYDYWSNLGLGGGDAGSLLERVVALPIDMVSPAVKLETLALLAAITGFIALRSPLVLLAVPTLVWRFMGDKTEYWGQGWHYSLILMPIMFAALIDGIRLARGSRRTWLQSYSRHVPAVAVTAGLLLCWQFPFGELIKPETYQASPRAEAAFEVLSMIPDGASVESDTGLMSRLTSRTRVYWIGGAPGAKPDFILIDDQAGWSPGPPEDLVGYAEGLHPGTTYEIALQEDGYSLLRRTS